MENIFNVAKKTMAFTLAETLIVIGVIGIVSALTLPNLNSSTGDKEKVAKVKKIYQNITDAFGRAEAVYGPYEEWFVNDTSPDAKAKRMGERISEFMKVSKNCGSGEGSTTGCFTSGNSHSMNGNASKIWDSANYYRIITADGSSVANNASAIIVDIDGPTKGKYTLGHDLFVFCYNADKKTIIPDGDNKTFAELASDSLGEGAYMASWIIKYDNADYLKIQSVSGSTVTCKNGNTMTETNPTCK
ncbi:type II secretion system protein [bacterium]|nr:type II secretion system protein [bacterium]